MLKAAAWLAVIFGASLAVLEVLRNWPNWQWWPFWVVDYICAALLIGGGLAVLRRGAETVRWLTAGWGFAFAMFWMSFFSHVGSAMETAPDAREQRITFVIGVMFALTLLGFIASLIAGRRNA